MTLEQIQSRYEEICKILGDIEVKMKGLSNHKDAIFKELELLDREAEKLQQPNQGPV